MQPTKPSATLEAELGYAPSKSEKQRAAIASPRILPKWELNQFLVILMAGVLNDNHSAPCRC